MAISDVFGSRLAGPAGRVLDAPLRALVHEILREQGYASPSEVQALRDDAKELAGRVSRAESRLADLVRGQDATLAELKESRDALRRAEAEIEAARAAVAAATAAATTAAATAATAAATAAAATAAAPAAPAAVPVPAAPAPLVAAPRGGCVVPECDGTVRSKGFCSPHYQQWRRGTLHGFVGQDGHVLIGKRSYRVSDDLAGKRAELVGDAVHVDGKAVSAR